MRQEPPELVALKRALGRQLAAWRDAAEIGQQQVARKTGYSRPSVAHAEAGRQLLRRDFWATADDLLEAGGALLAEYEQVLAAKQEHEQLSREKELAQAYAEARALRAASTSEPALDGGGLIPPSGQELWASLVAAVGAEIAGGLVGPLGYLGCLSSSTQAVPAEGKDQLYERLAEFLSRWANTVKRRELIQLLGWAAATAAASPLGELDTEEAERLARAIVSPSRVDDQVIDHIEAMLQSCKRQHDALGPQAVLRTVLAQRQLVGSLLDECPAELRPRLQSVYSEMSSSIGFYFFDLDDAAGALHYCDQARAAAQEARNTELAVWALCNMSCFASWQGRAHAAIDYAAAAQSLTSKTDDVLLQVCAIERSGVAYAIDGQYKESMTEFDRALAGFSASAGRISPESPAYWTHEGGIHSQQGYSLLWLDKPSEAAASATKGLQLFDTSFVGARAFTTLRLATARLRSGEIEEAARTAGHGATLATRNRSVRLTKEVQATRARLQPWQDTPAVKTLDEQLAGIGFASANLSR
ncbi:MAG: helix-turn-helix domain-containing protein [Pseudonocardiaceae bacterium]